MDRKSSERIEEGDLVARGPGGGHLATEDCTVRISRESRDAEWDRFLARCPSGHHEQTSLWAAVKAVYGWQPLRIVASRQNRILAGVQILTKRFGRAQIGYVMRGPVGACDDPQLAELLLGRLHEAAASERLTYLVVLPPYSGSILEPVLRGLGFRKKPGLLPPSGVMTATLLLDLSPDLNVLKAGMRKGMRENLRHAERAGVTVRDGDGADVEAFRQLMWALCARRGTSPAPPQKDFFEHLWRIFRPAGFVRIFVAEIEGTVVSALLTFPFGDTVRAWKIGWAGDHAESSPNSMLYWGAIRWSKQNGFRFFDIVQLDPDLARCLLAGEAVDWSSIDGMNLYKAGFGAKPVLLPEPYYRFYHPLLRVMARAGGSRLIESAGFGRLAERFWSQKDPRGEG